MASERIVAAPDLTNFATTLIGALGAPADIAVEVGQHLVMANMSGHDSHGVVRLPQYASQITAGALNPTARAEILREGGATSLIDAKRGFGQYSTAFTVQHVIEQARRTGIAIAAIRHSMHIGRVGEYTERAAAAGMVGIVVAGAAGQEVGAVGMPGATGRYLGTNPWSFAFPTEGGADPILFDGSMSTVAEGKVRLARASGQQLPPGSIVDQDGNPTTNPDDFYAGGAILPLGGAAAGHKGFALGLGAALLGGLSAVGDDDPTLLGAAVTGQGDPAGRTSGVIVIAIDPTFLADDGYPALVSRVADGLRLATPASGRPQPMLPGDPEARSRVRKRRGGVVVSEAVWADMSELAEKHSVQLPKTMA